MELSSSVDLDEYARETDGFSGADLQALVYNAHLEAIHSAAPQKNLNTAQDAESISYVVISDKEDGSIKSRAEDLALQKRVSYIDGIHIHT